MEEALSGVRREPPRRGVNYRIDDRLLPSFKPSKLHPKELRAIEDLPAAEDWVPHVNRRESPEKALVQASLTYAIREIKRGDSETLEWLEHHGDKPFSFTWTCQVLDLDPSWARSNMYAARIQRVVTHKRRARRRERSEA